MKVVSSKEISFFDLDKNKIVIRIGTELLIDVEENIAYVDGHHFDISKDEYIIIN